jgi:hypothetical protein
MRFRRLKFAGRSTALAAAVALLFWCSAALAQSSALVVPACGTQPNPFATGVLHVPIMDVNGNMCSSATSSGGTLTWPGTAALTNYGTAPTGTVPAVNAYVTNPATFAWPGTAALTAFGTLPSGTVPAVNAGAFQYGVWTVQPGNTPNTTPWLVSASLQAATTGGATPAIQNALTTPVVVKASAGQVYKVQCDNLAGSANAWVEIINAASSPALGTAVLDQIPLPVGGTGGFALPTGEAFATGISIGAATASNGATAVSTAVNCSVAYK